MEEEWFVSQTLVAVGASSFDYRLLSGAVGSLVQPQTETTTNYIQLFKSTS